MREGVPPLSSPDDPALTEAILERTSGSPCVRAREQLGDLTDGRLAATDTELMRLHLGHCRPCAALADTLAWLAEELPAMATLEPDDAFLADVLRATSRRPAPRPVAALERPAPGWIDLAAARLIGWWTAVLARSVRAGVSYRLSRYDSKLRMPQDIPQLSSSQ